MTVFILVREDQSAHGFVDTSICGVYVEHGAAEREMRKAQSTARTEGLLVEGDDDCPDGEWQASWAIQEFSVE